MAADDLEWEDWNPDHGSFIHHVIAGSLAGVTEHVLFYPIDTIKTHMQSCPSHPTDAIMCKRELMRGQSIWRLWRGVSTMFWGCIPAHAAYFSIIETGKAALGVNLPGHHVLNAAITGGVATIAHDAIMNPMDTIKQRMQLGLHSSVIQCFRSIVAKEGLSALYLSFPTTLAMNVPYGGIVLATNETVKKILNPSGQFSLTTLIIAGCASGALASSLTTPFDVIKTRLQTQAFTPVFQTAGSSNSVSALKYHGVVDVSQSIYREFGIRGFFRGVVPRMLVHTPSVAVSWTTYETIKSWLKTTK